MKCLLFSIFPLLVLMVSGQSDLDPPDPPTSATVTIAQGTVVGSKAVDGEYFQFHGIPYADSTSGAHRFKAPRPPPSFQDTFIANRKDIKCVRALGVGYEGTEDCLVANIFTPSINDTDNLPVMIWIKGREFDKVYEHELSFRNFMEKGVIVVSLNYRESVLGFLCLGTETAPGNAGLKDIIAGLKWVKENIEQFGGNPNDITIFGHGSGGAAVDLITLSPMANGLVNKAIAQSGNAMAPWAVSRDNLQYTIQVAEALGHIITDIQQLSEVFTRTSVVALMGVINELDLTYNALAFAPCIEREDLEDVEPFLTKTPSEILASGEFLDIPFITGFVDNEGTIRAQEALEDDWLKRMNTEFENFIQPDLTFQTEDERTKVAEQIRQFYFQNDEIDLSTIEHYIAYHGETMMVVSSIREVRARAQASSSFNYLYQFSYKGTLGESFVGPLELDTAAHSEELAYLFHGDSEGAPSTDLNIGKILVERWINFAKTGSPTSETSPVIWQPFTTNNNYYLRILDSDEIQDIDETRLEISLLNPHPDTLTFWDELYSHYFQDAESNWSLNVKDEGSQPDVPGPDDEDPNTPGADDEDPNTPEADDEDPNTPGADEEDPNTPGADDEDPNTPGADDEDPNTPGADEEDPNTTESEDEEDPTTDPDENITTTEAPGSASTVVGYTFLIMTLFSILDKFHFSVLVS